MTHSSPCLTGLQRVAACCSVLQCVAVCCWVLPGIASISRDGDMSHSSPGTIDSGVYSQCVRLGHDAWSSCRITNMFNMMYI